MGKKIRKYLNSGLNELGLSFDSLSFGKRNLSRYTKTDTIQNAFPKSDIEAFRRDLSLVKRDCQTAFFNSINE